MALDLPSIHDDSVPPLEKGGVVARGGFTFQDHVAVRFCLQMLLSPEIVEVRCESQDDITLVMSDRVEYVQVKASEPNQLWSVALLCNRKKKDDANNDGDGNKSKVDRAGTSIYEKSLANDCRSEPSRFRIVTSRHVNNDLKLLTFPFDSPERTDKKHQELSNRIEKNADGFQSDKGNGSLFWVSNTLWETEHSQKSLETLNISNLREYIETKVVDLTISQGKNIYEQLVELVRKAAEAKWEIDPQAKKIRRNAFVLYIDRMIAEAQKSSLTGVSRTMQEKMEAALLPSDYILTAHIECRSYRREQLNPRYLDTTERERLEEEVLAHLQHLRTELDTGNLPDSGVEFHRICLDKLKEIQESSLTSTKPDLSFLHGYMYYITGRCCHRFRRVST